MKRAIILASVLALLLCVLFSGCTSSSGTDAPATPAATPLPAPVQTAEPVAVITQSPAPTAIPTKEPIQMMPDERQVNLVLSKDRPTSEIHLLYQGGPGEIFVNKIFMRVYTSEDVYVEYIMRDGKKPIPGDEIVAPGTRGIDRCEVFVVSAGTRFKIMDEPALGGGYY